jgi:hypothetical protein
LQAKVAKDSLPTLEVEDDDDDVNMGSGSSQNNGKSPIHKQGQVLFVNDSVDPMDDPSSQEQREIDALVSMLDQEESNRGSKVPQSLEEAESSQYGSDEEEYDRLFAELIESNLEEQQQQRSAVVDELHIQRGEHDMMDMS